MSELERWKKYLRYDPTRWLLETNDPFILLGYQLDIAHRPEDARVVVETRERVLYSDPIQNIFAAQNEMGFWGDPENLAQPYYTSTLWNLALLAELGIPRTSRRARNACEFILGNFLDSDGIPEGVNLAEMGYLVRALTFFMPHDPRVRRAALGLQRRWRDNPSDEGITPALGAWTNFRQDAAFQPAIHDALDALLETCARGSCPHSIAFPQFHPTDTLLTLRVLAEHDRVHDPRAQEMVTWLTGLGDSQARFPLLESLNPHLQTPLEDETKASRWVTLNALRVIIKLVQSET